MVDDSNDVTRISAKSNRKPQSPSASVNRSGHIKKSVHFVDEKGRIWTSEMDLPADTNMETMLSIAKSNIGLMQNKEPKSDELVLFVEPEDKMQTRLADVDRVFIIARTKLQSFNRK
tara:strand:- start:6570 stop:6920 length:351 start_codon:yes stop_codon:yes gene_type:complete